MEVQSGYKTILLDTASYLGFHVLNLSKITMLNFRYKFLETYIERHLFNTILTDTDSLFLNLGKETLAQCVKPEMKQKFYEMLNGRCNDEHYPESYLPRTCCSRHQKWDLRRAGIFKPELENGEVIYALTSKTYYALTTDGTAKFTAKGVSRTAKMLDQGEDIFRSVLTTKQNRAVTIRGFRTIEGEIRTYELTKNAFPFVYYKRVLADDGIHTTALPVTLCPYKKDYVCIELDLEKLSPTCVDPKFAFTMNGEVFQSIMQALCKMVLWKCELEQTETSQELKEGDIRKLFDIYRKSGSAKEWGVVEKSIILDVLKARTSQHTVLKELLLASPSLKLLYCTEHSFRLGNGYSPDVTRWLPSALDAGFNLIGCGYQQLKNDFE